MDVFHLRNQLIKHYADYTQSFLNILDPDIREFTQAQLASGKLWPDALIQLSPAYEQAETIAELADAGVLHPQCAQIFQLRRPDGALESLRLYRHQRQAIDLAHAGKHYVVTTGTGSGKSLTYMVPIIDHVLRHQPEAGRVRAIIVYPMNALINSQDLALQRFLDHLPLHERRVRYARYTGQESEAQKQAIQRDPPHLLLTNYVMLELMLTRPEEFPLVDRDHAALQFIVLDELHTYRGRQGADVAMLMRRLRERCGNEELICIGTSATMASGPGQNDRRAAVARVASRIFGVPIAAEQVIEETLVNAIPAFVRPTDEQLRAALQAELPATLDWPTFQHHPLAAWIEQTYSLETDAQGRLQRARPRSLREGAQALAERTGVALERCMEHLQRFFQLGSAVRDPQGKPGFSFKLHQFISQGSAVYATLEAPAQRLLTLEGQRYAPGADGDRLLFPLVFCRECGQHYYLCAYDEREGRVVPRDPLTRGEDVQHPARAGYLIVGEEAWSEDQNDMLPDSWFSYPRRGPRKIKKEWTEFVPRRLYVAADGTVTATPSAEHVTCWFLPTPFMTCLQCGVVYTKRERNDFSKLARLSSEGRSTATTLLTLAALNEMRRSDLPPEAQKLLSFTDNRQDASLQAGHLNDFVNVALLRAAICAAVRAPDAPLDHRLIARRVCEALNLEQHHYASAPATGPEAQRSNEAALIELLDYRIYEDLRRSWRVTQPNLEQCGLLRIDYANLKVICADDARWQAHPVLRDSTPEQRERAVRALLEHLRRELAINAPVLDPQRQDQIKRNVNAKLNEAWRFDENEELRQATAFVLPGADNLPEGARSLSARTAIGRFLRSRDTWPVLNETMSEEEYEPFLTALIEVLCGNQLLIKTKVQGHQAVQVRYDALLWCAGDGQNAAGDLVRARRMTNFAATPRPVNRFFHDFYSGWASRLRGVEGREHTGQVKGQRREAREERFRHGALPILFCSPTMELGIDIADLNLVHLRNVPPTPANYAQRSGRAGRSGQPALIVTYCSVGSGHDQYFFQRPIQMVAGVVAPPQIELANEDLIRAHVHAVWLAATGCNLGHSMIEVINTADPSLPLHAEVRARLELTPAQREAVLDTCRRMLATAQAELAATAWYSDAWLHSVIANAATAFDRACDRWRELYRAAQEQLQEARQHIDLYHHQRHAREKLRAAEQREREAKRQRELLTNAGDQQGESDFYPYRYLASEGFLPGYNFPRLPVRAFLRTGGDEAEYLARPRFLAITEFGPQNVIYHEGRKYRVTRTQTRSGSLTQDFIRIKICRRCGYLHEGATLEADLCAQCATLLSGSAVELLPSVLEMPTQLTQRVERISCEEEERLREGYIVTTHYQFARDHDRLRRQMATLTGADMPALTLSYGPQATIWRINRGWRRMQQPGFALELQQRRWHKRPGEEDAPEPCNDSSEIAYGVQLFVRDTRNLLLVDLPAELEHATALSLQYALQRGIQEVFQLEEQELSSELLGESAPFRILLWEATEGGAGVLRRIVEEPEALARVALEALRICHSDPTTGQELDAGECARACYRCLLSYSNQPWHALLDRRLVIPLLQRLSHARIQRGAEATPNDDAPGDLPPFAQRVYAILRERGYRLPDAILPLIAGRRPHFFYQPDICVLCHEAGQSVAALKEHLEDSGCRVIVIDNSQHLEEQLARHTFWS
ncbi:DEAD/DEAH box helicase [Kallotenue papyrolyticum]|uniref:DEAD/DEAH box helicase n=1 Tax=Kallotenue papyrolyticum TaxID=1325125 RepID=UPI00049255E9|nr:DEAD/DEAH box helicase [Kallotenue papyrolyticum]